MTLICGSVSEVANGKKTNSMTQTLDSVLIIDFLT
jgi:hypothetical protein